MANIKECANEYQIYYEHTITNYEHHEGTNEYVFNFPDHWIQYPSKQHLVALRSINILPATRDFFIKNIQLKRDGVDAFSVDLSMRLYLSCNEDMGVLNDKLNKAIYNIYKEYSEEVNEARISSPGTHKYLSVRDYTIFYTQTDNSLIFRILSTGVNNPFYFKFLVGENDDLEYTSDDFKYMVGIPNDDIFKNLAKYQNNTITKEDLDTFLKTLPNVEVRFNDNNAEGVLSDNESKMITDIIFKNVWNRNNLIISSTLSSLSENRYLTMSNTRHNPPKVYEINGYNTRFSIFLFDPGNQEQRELPTDSKDIITIEIILIAL